MNAILKPATGLAVATGSSTLAAKLEAKYPGRITGSLVQAGQGGEYAPFPGDLPEPLVRALRVRGIERLYSHQARAWEATQAGRHLVVATPTASGKSLCYTLPVVASARSLASVRGARENAIPVLPIKGRHGSTKPSQPVRPGAG